MTGMQKRLLLSPVAFMWAEDEVRLEIGMPGAPREKKEAERMRWKKKGSISRHEDITSNPQDQHMLFCTPRKSTGVRQQFASATLLLQYLRPEYLGRK